MADLPFSSYASVTGQLLLSVADTNLDPDKYPDGVFASGKIYLNPTVTGGFLRFPVQKQVVVPKPITLILDAQAFVTSNGSREVYVPPTDEGNPVGWAWTVAFEVKDPEGNDLPILGYEVQTPKGVETDIFNSAPVETGGGVLTVQGPPGPGVLLASFEAISDTAVAIDESYQYVYVATAPLVFTLPTPVGRTLPYRIKNASTGDVTIASPAGTMEDGNSIVIYPQESVDLYPVGSDWRVI